MTMNSAVTARAIQSLRRRPPGTGCVSLTLNPASFRGIAVISSRQWSGHEEIDRGIRRKRTRDIERRAGIHGGMGGSHGQQDSRRLGRGKAVAAELAGASAWRVTPSWIATNARSPVRLAAGNRKNMGIR